MLDCNVTILQIQAECITPAGFGIGLSVLMTVLGQPCASDSLVNVSYALPVVLAVGAGTAGTGLLLVRDNTVTVMGHSLGAPGYLLLDGVPVAAASVQPGHTRMSFYLSVLPLLLVGQPTVSASVLLQGLASNSLPLAAAPPSISLMFPLSIDDTRPASACTGAAIMYWVTVSGINFGVNSSTTSLTLVGMPGTTGVCYITDSGSSLVFGTNSSTGSVTVVLGALTSMAVVFNANQLLQRQVCNRF